MPTRPSKEVVTIYLEVPPALKDELQGMATRYGHSLKEECVAAFKRHIAYPPPLPEAEAIQPFPDESPKAKKARGK